MTPVVLMVGVVRGGSEKKNVFVHAPACTSY